MLTLVLARQIMERLSALQETVAQVTLDHLRQGVPFGVGQGLIYREIRRARINNRPLGLLAIEPTFKATDFAVDRYFKEAQSEVVRKYVAARIADLLVGKLDDYNIVTQRKDHFVALIAEAEPEKVARVIAELKKAARMELGVELKIGQSTFPDEAVTFEQLLVRAEAQMHAAENGAAVEESAKAGAPAEPVLPT